MKKTSYFPNLSDLLPLLKMQTIIQYPKLQLLLYDCLKPFICIFDNEYLSFIDYCSNKFKLLDFNKFKIVNNTDKDKHEKDRKAIRRFGPMLAGT